MREEEEESDGVQGTTFSLGGYVGYLAALLPSRLERQALFGGRSRRDHEHIHVPYLSMPDHPCRVQGFISRFPWKHVGVPRTLMAIYKHGVRSIKHLASMEAIWRSVLFLGHLDLVHGRALRTRRPLDLSPCRAPRARRPLDL